MDLHGVMESLQNLGFVSIGKGPKHPEGNSEMQPAIAQFLAAYPTIAHDHTFVNFLEYYSAVAIDWPDEKLTMEIYGFSPEITFIIGQPEENLVDYQGFFRFSEILVKPGPNGEEGIAGQYAFDITGNRRTGIYQKTIVWSVDSRKVDYGWYCETFLEWLFLVVEATGRLPLITYGV